MFNNNEIETIIARIDETNNDALTIIDVATTTFATRDDNDDDDDMTTRDMMISCM